ncbi:MAG: tRNA (adenosine(37)-N6)-threonylcarbamoyltransferase complex transferase subunit TsaD [Candidatus Pacebacteria bacterium]|nr:tRNA (adenosine(37)-N6)-threonylcarbamoyltransferase complex transferase subunit TsaD [Candidatus Paceibacterota bacterium]MDD3510079.1 tRNA (adenosine(37)-N6)-threonylcarbamoyltransferase complex transferase subunit TsaD [Candidatus Paceibacterota bacterium]MDD4664802.1 tRNA (adenosine(37)-N6)-threonylcarbamoyltransferase complex transferase subunit TsaD [Candidatus Paceibacterota bacterium]
MNILAIETSCDDTGIAILKKNKNIKVLADFLSSQDNIHKEYGGIHPSIAKREHAKNIFPLFLMALKKAKLLKKGKTKVKKETYKILERYPELSNDLITFLETHEKPNISKIAVATHPGLEPCLYVGINFAKALALNWNIKVAGVNHIKAHILVNFLNKKEIKFPALALILSGGNTKMLLMESIEKYKELGSTRDDAIGECLDKTARLLGLPYPGGPEIEKRAQKTKKSEFKLPRPMLNSKDYDFSFSGLKTAVLYTIKDKHLTQKQINELSFEIQNAVIETVLKKTEKALLEFNPVSILIGGGVTSNKKLQKALSKLAKKYNVKLHIPKYKTDNAVMIGVSALISPNFKNYDTIIINNDRN